MKIMYALLPAIGILPAFLPECLAANSWTGANNYYVYTLPTGEQETLFQAMSDAGMKVLRTWVTGLDAGQKDSDNSAVGDLEHGGLGNYDDHVLDLIDQTMVIAHNYGVKLLIGMHDVNALEAGDAYSQAAGSAEAFYTDETTIEAFNNRITYILNVHKHQTLGQPWSELGSYIFGLEAQNEPMIFDQNFYTSHLDWICNTAKQIRGNVGNPDMLILTGGGSGSASVQSTFFDSSCAIDVVAIHDYNDDWDNFMSNAVSQAQAAGKKLLVEEWGSLYSSDDASRLANLENNIQKINNYGVPWLYWELITNPDPHYGQDYEIEVNGADWSTLESESKSTAGVTAAFDFSAALAL
ncbi:glycoside hydrolase [Gloeophyllum trabeum ATCC 11539]|uniref:mannan endo-1,4-beta-mannosidase n=1 Tax=Gloeophyllum trabeum (strain ATCC 11539 / FP-39264 / Madison 617) TaxID=670483 RepID=S7PTV1_GLOTA|nr:glycoside hydrolase [Gloeophyllum trabeum ATCC 11539]EPQ51226.1 glycoside hydrolase [Gloeophyllum trabeum ATCC 11539]